MTLRLAESPSGLWSTLAVVIANSGHSDWRVNHRAPQQVYLRSEVRDRTGNRAVHQLEQPTANDRLVPPRKILGIDGINGEPEVSARPQWPRW